MNHFIPIEDLERENPTTKQIGWEGELTMLDKKEPYKEEGSWNCDRTTVYLLLEVVGNGGTFIH
jgi:hypothetical protein